MGDSHLEKWFFCNFHAVLGGFQKSRSDYVEEPGILDTSLLWQGGEDGFKIVVISERLGLIFLMSYGYTSTTWNSFKTSTKFHLMSSRLVMVDFL